MKYLYLFLSLTILACSTEYTQLPHEIIENYQSLKIDKETPHDGLKLSIKQIDSIQVLSVYNQLNNSLYLYNFYDGSLIKKLPFELEGPNGTHPNYNLGVKLLNMDSLILFNYPNQQLSIYKNLIKIKNLPKFYNILNKDTMEISFSIDQYKNPFYMIDEKNAILKAETLFTWFPEIPFNTRPNIIKADLTTGKTSIITVYPEYFDKYFWGHSIKYESFYTLNLSKDKIFVSYAIDDSVYVYDTNGKPYKSLLIKSPQKDLAKPVDGGQKAFYNYIYSDTNKDRLSEEVFSSTTYGPIYIDHSRQILYRRTKVGLKDFDKNDKFNADFELLAYDLTDEKFIGSIKIDGAKYSKADIFIDERGIFLIPKKQKRENALTFDLLKVKFDEI